MIKMGQKHKIQPKQHRHQKTFVSVTPPLPSLCLPLVAWLSSVDGVHDPGPRVHAVLPFLPHHAVLPVRAERGPHRPARGPHHLHAPHRARAALLLLRGLLHPAAQPAHRHDERHALEGGAGERRALEDSGTVRARSIGHAKSVIFSGPEGVPRVPQVNDGELLTKLTLIDLLTLESVK